MPLIPLFGSKPSKFLPGGDEMRFLISWGYVVLIVPFRIRIFGSVTTLKVSTLHKTICRVLHTSVVILSIIVWVVTTMQKKLKGNPAAIFDMLLYIMVLAVIYTTVYTVWWQNEAFQNLFNALGHGNRFFGYPIGITARMITRLLSLMNILLFCAIALYPRKETMVGLAIHVLQFPPNSTLFIGDKMALLPWWHLMMDDQCKWIYGKILIVPLFVVYMYFLAIAGFGQSLMYAGSFTAFRIATELRTRISDHIDDKEMTKLYKEAKYRIGLINDIMSTFGLISVATVVLYVSYVASGLSTWHPVSQTVHIAAFICVAISLVLAAEAHRKMLQSDRIIIQSNPNAGTILSAAQGENGLKGWEFFTISYPFLGSVITAIFTYGLVAVQFSMPAAMPSP